MNNRLPMSRLLPVLLLGCSAPEPQLSDDEAQAIEAAAPAIAALSATEVAGSWGAEQLDLELRSDGTYLWSRPAEVERPERVPPFAQEGRWVLHSASVDPSGIERASALRLGPDGSAGTIVPILGTASQPLLERVPGAVALTRN